MHIRAGKTIACQLSAIATSLEKCVRFCGVSPTINLNNADEGECEAGNKCRQSVHSAFFLYVLVCFRRDMNVQLNRQMTITVDNVARRVTF